MYPVVHRPPAENEWSLAPEDMRPASPVDKPRILLDQMLRHFGDLPRFVFHADFPFFARLWLNYQCQLVLAKDPKWRLSVYTWLGDAVDGIQYRLDRINPSDQEVEASTSCIVAALVKLKGRMTCMRQVLKTSEFRCLWPVRDFHGATAPLGETLNKTRQRVVPPSNAHEQMLLHSDTFKSEQSNTYYGPAMVSWSSRQSQMPIGLPELCYQPFQDPLTAAPFIPSDVSGQMPSCYQEQPSTSMVLVCSAPWAVPTERTLAHPTANSTTSNSVADDNNFMSSISSISSSSYSHDSDISEKRSEDMTNSDNEKEDTVITDDDQRDKDYEESSEEEEEEEEEEDGDESEDFIWKSTKKKKRSYRSFLYPSKKTRGQRRRRTATSYDSETTHYLKSVFFNIYSKQDKLTKEQRLRVQRHTGLKPRNITYWFSNHKRRFQTALQVFRQTVRESNGQVKTYNDFLEWRRNHGLPEEIVED
ncbi:hypothetical protein EC973_001108 [Apophysomyces ossiformis]|uniref:Homeobox domain-containing protein n=1 Tax=Apophysomyces ossiformis TaxID=679940 RepID=A0A8H7BK99_9FUNG|nr:hypothetical protein EC973_001108 [Apophysomyces ossiformis]